jgi:hypothetical protein
MSNRVLLKKSSVAAKVPLGTDLEYGELALNYTDEKIYFKNASNVVKFISAVETLATVTGRGATTSTAIDIRSAQGTGTTAFGARTWNQVPPQVYLQSSTQAIGAGGSIGFGAKDAGTSDYLNWRIRSVFSAQGVGYGANMGLLFDAGIDGGGTTALTNVLALLGNGNVGIGTTAPLSKFVVNGGTVSTTYTASEARMADGSIHLMKTVAGGIFEAVRAMNFDTTVGTTVRVLGAATSDPFNNANGGKVFIDAIRTSTNMDLAFSLNDAAGAAPVERVRFMGSGAVGIGTSAPYSRLTVIPSSDATTPTAANQITIGESSKNTAYRLQLGYMVHAGAWKGSIQSIAGGGSAPLILNGDGGNVGVGTSSPSYALEVNGSFAATTKSFVIDHPTKPGMQLRYGSLEGPENGVYIRGRLKGNKIELPEYWTKLVDPDSITVNLTAIGKSQNLYVEDIKDNVVYVGGKNVNCFYTVFAERIDVEKLEVEIG